MGQSSLLRSGLTTVRLYIQCLVANGNSLITAGNGGDGVAFENHLTGMEKWKERENFLCP